jgi:hypothetical protein
VPEVPPPVVEPVPGVVPVLGVVRVPEVPPPVVVPVPEVPPPVVVPVPEVPPPVVVPVPGVAPAPPLVSLWLQADKANGRIAKLRAKVLAQTILDKLKGFIVVVPFQIVNSCKSLTFKFKNSETIPLSKRY